jgi:hypothetical protein
MKPTPSTKKTIYDAAARWEDFGLAALEEDMYAPTDEQQERQRAQYRSDDDGSAQAYDEDAELAALLNTVLRGSRVEGFAETVTFSEIEVFDDKSLARRQNVTESEPQDLLSIRREEEREEQISKAKRMVGIANAKNAVSQALGAQSGLAAKRVLSRSKSRLSGTRSKPVTVIIFMADLYTLFAEPSMISQAHFGIGSQTVPPPALIGLSTVCDFVFLLDALLGSFNGLHYPTRATGRVEQVEFSKTLRTCVADVRVLIDVCTFVPVQLIIFTQNHKFGDVDILMVLSFAKILRIFPAMRALSTAATWNMSMYTWTQLVRYMSILLVTAHWLGCYWLVTISKTVNEYDAYSDCDRAGMLAARDYGQSYVCALYWSVQTVTSIGYGDMTPISRSERAVFVICMILGTMVLYTLLLSLALGGSPDAELSLRRDARTKLDYLKNRGVPEDVLNDAVSAQFVAVFNKQMHCVFLGASE